MDYTYVNRLLVELQEELRGFHTRINEIELIKYLEDPIALAGEEKPTGLEIRIGATSELIENIKSALTSNLPSVRVKALRSGDLPKANSSKREEFWTAFLKSLTQPVPTLNELVDAQAGLGIGILKASYYPWPKSERRRLNGEPDEDYKDRQRALKRQWGPPFKVITIHPLTFFFRLGPGNEISRCIEHGWKPKDEVEAAYGKRVKDASAIASIVGQPTEDIRALPSGVSSSTMSLVTEYWSPDLYQCYVDGRLVDEESPPTVSYFFAVGRTSSSKDPDKFGLSVAEIFRHNEPILNRTLTRMAEAAELGVRKRLTLEVPEGYTPEVASGEDNRPRTWKFKPGETEALPAGARVVDPFEGSERVYNAMPFVELMLRLMGEHGVSPIFKGIPPGAAGSGYRDNSLYLMARSQFQYLLDSYSTCICNLVKWLEHLLVAKARQEIWVDELSLVPSDVSQFPAMFEVVVTPSLPQNIIAEGQFYDRMHARGHIPRRAVLEKGLKEEQPEQLLKDRMEEDVQAMLLPALYQDVIMSVGVAPKPTGLVGPDGQPIASPGGGGAPGGVEQLMAEMRRNGGQGEAGMASGGYTRAGQSRQPPEEAGAFPPGMEE